MGRESFVGGLKRGRCGARSAVTSSSTGTVWGVNVIGGSYGWVYNVASYNIYMLHRKTPHSSLGSIFYLLPGNLPFKRIINGLTYTRKHEYYLPTVMLIGVTMRHNAYATRVFHFIWGGE